MFQIIDSMHIIKLQEGEVNQSQIIVLWRDSILFDLHMYTILNLKFSLKILK